MILLTSDGISTKPLEKEFANLQHQFGTKLAFIPDAMNFSHGRKEIITETLHELEHLGTQPQVFWLAQEKPEDLKQFDIIYLGGGNVFYLLNVIRTYGYEKCLKNLEKEKLLVGVSAGSLVLQSDLQLIYHLIPRMNKNVKLKDFTALNFKGVPQHLPHKTRYTNTIDSFEKRVKTFEKKTGTSIICLEDGQGILVENEEYRLIL